MRSNLLLTLMVVLLVVLGTILLGGGAESGPLPDTNAVKSICDTC